MGKETGFFQCYNSVFREGKLTAHEKVVFCVVLSLSKGGTEDVFVSYETIAKFAGIGRTKAYTCIRQLMKKKFLKYAEKQKRNSKSYRVVKKWTVHHTNKSCSPDEHQKFTTRTGEVHEMNSTNSTSLNITPTNKENNKKKVSPEEIPFTEILEYLSKVSGKRHNVNKLNKKYISGRWRDGHRLPDFKKVIDVCNAKWKDNKDMCDFIQPSTLFNTKFEERLNWSLPKEEFHPAQRPDYDDSELPYNKQAIIDMQRARND
jgi:uncharacterized phage protein (TIGR02220 family)